MSVEDVVMSEQLPTGKSSSGRGRHRGTMSKQRRTDEFRTKKNAATKQAIDDGIRQRLKLDKF